MKNQWIGCDFQFWEGSNAVMVRQQTGGLRRKVLLVVVVTLKREVFVVGVAFFVVLIVAIVQMHKIHDADFSLVTVEVMQKVMKKCARFDNSPHNLMSWRAHCQHQGRKEYRTVFLHGGKVTFFVLLVLILVKFTHL